MAEADVVELTVDGSILNAPTPIVNDTDVVVQVALKLTESVKLIPVTP